MLNHSTFSKINSLALVFTLIVITFLGIMRFSTLLLFANPVDIQNNLSVMGDLAWTGLKFDLRVVGMSLLAFVYLPYLFFIWKKNNHLLIQWVKVSLSVLLALIIFIAFIDIGYFLFFGTPIDILIFGLFEDDTMAVVESGLSDYKLILVFIFALLTTFLLVWLFLKISRALLARAPLFIIPKRKWALIALLPLVMLAARGSAGTFPLTLKQSSVSSNSFINSLTQNAIFHLKYAINNRTENNLNKSSSKILAEAKVKDIDELLQKAGFDSKQPLLQKTAQNSFLENNPPHVIFVQMEGWSTHIALNDDPDDFPVLGSFRKHAKEDYFLPNFFCNQNGTNPTIENILLNSPLTPLSQSSGYKTSFSTSNVRPFKRKGYDAFFFSGGYSSWRNHDIFWPKQGFDKYIGRTVIEEKFQVKAKDNPWGAYDEYLFKYLESDLPKRNKATFYYILTTNNHPPVRLPADYHAPAFNLEKMGYTDDLEHKKLLLSGYHYQTNALGEFLDWLKNSPFKDKVIVVATGDHPLRGFDDYTSTEKKFLHFAVPAYFYLPKKYDIFKNRPKELIEKLYGSHADIFPTLFELALSDASYYSFGTPVMQKTLNDSYGWNYKNVFVTNDGVIDTKTKQLYTWSNPAKTRLKPEGKAISSQQQKIIEEEKYRIWLKEYLLYKDKERAVTN